MSAQEVSILVQSIARKQPSFSKKEEILLSQLFELADRTKSRHVEPMEVKQISESFKQKGLNVSENDVNQVILLADKAKDRRITIPAVIDVPQHDEEELKVKAELAIKAYDRNRDGMVSKYEMAVVSGKKLSKEQIDRCFEINDKDGDGYLNSQEMADMLRRRKETLTKKASKDRSQP
ncbi:hypothetical protein TCAL_01381 [Tigriopus californicus]|uniref:EF-hand domain-containing protein n=1 Tax=Tigriopus californicus TaxID=6832 RepID=A0A553NST3_TIGCA|nr:troponin C, isotype gamma-like [Tigriopus californicus]TRY68487.1 hypothetical protein TCAL_01381 [Tigriopus californicus]|eukprot:TCALIF_01381-PA protein Name:"Protein of unknown function" AED:0.00 eAED:0.00 QI:180/1/1/1/1/1/2/299/177